MSALALTLRLSSTSVFAPVGNQGAKERTILKTEQLPPPLSTLPVIPEGNFDDPPYFRESPPASPTIPEGAETGETLPSVATGHNNNRPNQTNSVDVDVDATGNNGFKTETQQVIRCCCAYMIIK